MIKPCGTCRSETMGIFSTGMWNILHSYTFVTRFLLNLLYIYVYLYDYGTHTPAHYCHCIELLCLHWIYLLYFRYNKLFDLNWIPNKTGHSDGQVRVARSTFQWLITYGKISKFNTCHNVRYRCWPLMGDGPDPVHPNNCEHCPRFVMLVVVLF